MVLGQFSKSESSVAKVDVPSPAILQERAPLKSSPPTAMATPVQGAHRLAPIAESPPAPSVPSIGGENVLAKWETPPLAKEERIAAFELLNKEVVACRRCSELVCFRKQTVFGVGNVMPRIAFFGEAPGADEDRQGIPFVGRAGQLLDKIIAASQLRREDVYILNSLKCRPPGNRTPADTEIENCRPYFEKQLEILQPAYIVCLGSVAVRAVLKSTESVGRLRGRFHRFKNAKVLVTYHPSYLLRNESAKRFTWEDMQLLMKDLGIPIPPPRSN